jgi:hypothetical protein
LKIKRSNGVLIIVVLQQFVNAFFKIHMLPPN